MTRSVVNSKAILALFGMMIPLVLYKAHRRQQEGNKAYIKESDSTCAHVRGDSKSESSGSHIMHGALGVLRRLYCADDSESWWRKIIKGILVAGLHYARAIRSPGNTKGVFETGNLKLIY